jgi:hypothetical protein
MVELVCLIIHILIIIYGFYIFLGAKFFSTQQHSEL